MKKSFISILLIVPLALALFIPSCGGGSPESVVANFSMAVMDGDMTKAKKYCTDTFNGTYLAGASAMEDMMPDLGEDKPSKSDLLENLESEINGETARVWSSDAAFLVYELKKEAGGWKISGFDMSAMMEGLGDVMGDMPGMPGS